MRVRAVGDSDGVLQVLGRGDDWVEIAIWNPDGSRAEMSGNGTRIAARWLRRTERSVTVRVGPREVQAPSSARTASSSRTWARSPSAEPEEVDGIRLDRRRRRQPARGRRRRPRRPAAHRPAARDAPAVPAPDERAGRAAARRRRDRGARVGARRGGDGVVGHERGRGRRGVRLAADDRPLSRAGRSRCGSRAGARSSPARRARAASRRCRSRAARRSATSSGRSTRCAGR